MDLRFGPFVMVVATASYMRVRCFVVHAAGHHLEIGLGCLR